MSKNYAVCCREVLSNIFNSIDTMSSNYVRQRNGNYNWFLRVQKCSVAFKIYVFVYNSSGTSVNIANESRWQLAATLKETIKTWLITIIDAHFYILNSESEFDCIVSLRNLIFFKYKKKSYDKWFIFFSQFFATPQNRTIFKFGTITNDCVLGICHHIKLCIDNEHCSFVPTRKRIGSDIKLILV